MDRIQRRSLRQHAATAVRARPARLRQASLRAALAGLALACAGLVACGDAADRGGAPVPHAQAGAGGGERPAKLGLCVACHGETGRGQQPGQPHLGGQDAGYLAAALGAYRDGSRRDPVMNAVAGTLSAEDIAALARWYAAQPCHSGEAGR